MTNVNHAEVASVLHRAADLIEQRGWAEGEGWEHEQGGPLCLEGGIMAAAGLTFAGEGKYSCPAYRAVREYLSERTSKLPFMWNDSLVHDRVIAAIDAGETRQRSLAGVRAEAEEQAASEVIETLRAAAAIEQARHDAEQPATVAVGA